MGQDILSRVRAAMWTAPRSSRSREASAEAVRGSGSRIWPLVETPENDEIDSTCERGRQGNTTGKRRRAVTSRHSLTTGETGGS